MGIWGFNHFPELIKNLNHPSAMKKNLFCLLAVFYVIVASNVSAYAVDLVVSGDITPASAKGTYIPNGTLYGHDSWKRQAHPDTCYYIYYDEYGGSYYWNIDLDTDDTEILFYSESNPPDNSPVNVSSWDDFSGSIASGIPVVEEAYVSGPEITVEGKLTAITDGDATPVLDDHTHFGSIDISSGTIVRTFTIKNSGDAVLNISGVTIGGTDAGSFSLSAPPASSVAISGSTTFNITFDPSTEGAHEATISIANDDSDESPHNFSIKGYGFSPRGVTVSGYTSPSDANGYYAHQGVLNEYQYWKHTTKAYYIFNDKHTGNYYWNIDRDSIVDYSNDNYLHYKVSDAGTPVGLTGWETAKVPPDEGTPVISDADPVPDINLWGNENSISDGDITTSFSNHTNFGSVDVSSGSRTRIFTIQNGGGATLTLSGSSPYVTISGTGAADFSLTSWPATDTIASNDTTTFAITYTPSGEETSTATVSIGSDDSDENPYTFTIQGTGFSPRNIQVSDITTPGGANGKYIHQGTLYDSQCWKHESNNYYIYSDNHTNGNRYWNIDTDTIDSAVNFYSSDHGNDPSPVDVLNWGAESGNSGTPNLIYAGPEINIKGNGISIADNDTTPSVTDDTDFGKTDLLSGTITKTFTLENTGVETLNISSVSLSSATHFSIVSTVPDTITAGDSDSIDIRFDPAAAGDHTVTLTVNNDDSNESTYNFDITGKGVDIVTPTTQASDITLTAHAAKINLGWTRGDGDKCAVFVKQTTTGTASPVNDTTYTANAAYGSGGQVGTSGWYCVYNGTGTTVDVAQLFPYTTYRTMVCEYNENEGLTRYNTGAVSNNVDNAQTIPIIINEVDVDTEGTDAAEFIELYDGGTGNTSLDNLVLVLYNGDTDTGYEAFDLDGHTTDANGYFVIGNTAVPGVDLTFADDFLQDGADAAALYVGNDTDFPNGTAVTTTNLVDAIVYDTGQADDAGLLSLLNSSEPQVNEAHRSDSESHSLQRIPNGSGGTRNTSTYVAETPTPKAENVTLSVITVEGNSTIISNGDITPDVSDHTLFADTIVNGGTTTRTYTIKNSGLEILSIDSIVLTGTHSGDFSVTAAPASPIAASTGSTDFTVTFNPSDRGTRTATLNIYNNDADRSPYNFDIEGDGIAIPEIAVSGNGNTIPDGDVVPDTIDGTSFGNADIVTDTVVKAYTITNSGADTLFLTGADPYIALTGDTADFAVSLTPSDTILPNGDTTTFRITFDPVAVGTRSVTVSIANDDNDENPYTFAIEGNGTAVPEIAISGNGNTIADGDTIPDIADNTIFGSINIDTVSVEKEFVITNSGSDTLFLTDADPYVTLTGDTADFSVSQVPADTILPVGGTGTFRITFAPVAVGTRSATVSIANDDSDENPYSFKIQGTGQSAPVLNNIETTALVYDEGTGTQVITDSVTIEDSDDTHLQYAVVKISVNYQNSEDMLAFTDTANITGVWNETTGILTLTGYDTKENYQAALRNVKYENMNIENPDTLIRTISFQVNDSVFDSDIVTRDIEVNRTNNNVPVIAPGQVFSVNENSPIDTPLGTISVDDLDEGTIYQGWIINANTDGDSNMAFRVNDSGEIVVNDVDEIDAEVNASFSAQVTVSDGANTSGAVTVTININDLNDVTPVVDAAQSFTIDEGPALGTLIGTIQAGDGDITPVTLTDWTITTNADPNSNGTDALAIDTENGQLSVNDPDDFSVEADSAFNIAITVSDGELTSLPESITINVKDTTVITSSGILELSDVNVYPNPANDILNVKVDKPCVIRLFDTAGNAVLEHEFAGGIQEIDVKSFTPGIYYLEVQANNKRTVKKIVIR